MRTSVNCDEVGEPALAVAVRGAMEGAEGWEIFPRLPLWPLSQLAGSPAHPMTRPAVFSAGFAKGPVIERRSRFVKPGAAMPGGSVRGRRTVDATTARSRTSGSPQFVQRRRVDRVAPDTAARSDVAREGIEKVSERRGEHA